MDIQQAINQVLARDDLSQEQMRAVMMQIMTGAATPAQIGGFLVGLRMKGETVDEITGAAEVMRELATAVAVDPANLVDTCGTGGDGGGLFNVSTACAFVVAAAGGRVAKHGNRSISGKSGSADLLEAAGVKLDLTPEQVTRCIDEVGVGFMFAVQHHGAMKYAITPRRELGARTIFNLLGPLTNPAAAPYQVLGVYSREWVRPMAEVLQRLGSQHVMVVHSEDGLDELSLAAPSYVAELKDGEIREYTLTPEEVGLTTTDLSSCEIDSVGQSLQLVQAALKNQHSVASDMVAYNSGAALYVSGMATSLQQGVELAQDMISTAIAAEKLKQLAEFTQCLA